MRVMLRTGPVLLAAALLVLAPTISPGGGPVINKGPFDINPREEEPNTPFDLSVHGEDCFDPNILDSEDAEAESSSTSSSSAAPEASLLGIDSTNVHVQVVGPRPSDEVVASEDYEPGDDDFDPGEWGSPPLIPFPDGLPAGTYLVTAECQHLLLGSDGSETEAALMGGSDREPMFVLLGDQEEAECTDESPVGTPGNLGPGCYEPQELVIEVAAAEAEEEEPTFTG